MTSIQHEIQKEINKEQRAIAAKLRMYEIKESDLGRNIGQDFGKVLPGDVGKRIHYDKGLIFMENNEQLCERKGGSWDKKKAICRFKR